MSADKATGSGSRLPAFPGHQPLLHPRPSFNPRKLREPHPGSSASSITHLDHEHMYHTCDTLQEGVPGQWDPPSQSQPGDIGLKAGLWPLAAHPDWEKADVLTAEGLRPLMPGMEATAQGLW